MKREKEHKHKVEDDEVISPLDFMDDVEELQETLAAAEEVAENREHRERPGRGERRGPWENRPAKAGRTIFISATDTGVGKTTVIKALVTLLKDKGLDVGVMKPVQCGGEDAKSLKEFLQLTDPMEDINPYSAKQAISPHLAFRHDKIQVHREKILATFQRLRRRHDVLIVEGAGGLMVPIREDYQVIDLIKDMEAELIIVSRPGLGTINHTLLTVEKARSAGITVGGVIFNEAVKAERGVPERTNPGAVSRLGKVTVLGTVPFFPELSQDAILKACRNKINLRPFTSPPVQKKTAQWIADDKKYVWHPFTQMKEWLETEPLIIEKAKGCYLFDAEGRRYLDGISSLWVTLHGHSHPEIVEAVDQCIRKLDHSTMLGLANVPAIELARRLVQIAPRGLEKVFYSDNGSTSVEIAIKMAYQYWQNTGKSAKVKMLHLANSYHGDTLGSVSVGGIDLFHQIYSKLIFPTIKVDFPDGYRTENFEEALQNLENTLKETANETAALIVEPLVQAAGGMIMWPEGTLKKIKELCEKYEVFLIADEVATGFGRTGKMFACDQEGVTPDFLCVAKGLTGGTLPLAATLTTQKVFDGFLFDYKDQKAFFHGHSFTGNPIACSAAIANLDIFRHEHTLAKMQPKIKFLGEKLEMFYNLPHVGQVRQKGFMVGIELVKDKETKEPFAWEDQIGVKVCQEVRKRGVILRPLGNVIVLMPSLSISLKELDYLLRITFWAIKIVTRGWELDAGKNEVNFNLSEPGS